MKKLAFVLNEADADAFTALARDRAGTVQRLMEGFAQQVHLLPDVVVAMLAGTVRADKLDQRIIEALLTQREQEASHSSASSSRNVPPPPSSANRPKGLVIGSKEESASSDDLPPTARRRAGSHDVQPDKQSR